MYECMCVCSCAASDESAECGDRKMSGGRIDFKRWSGIRSSEVSYHGGV